MNVEDSQGRECFAVLLRAVAVVLFEAISRVNLTRTTHQLALDDLREAARERNCRDECIGLCKGMNPGVELEMSIFKPIRYVDERDAGVYGLELFF